MSKREEMVNRIIKEQTDSIKDRMYCQSICVALSGEFKLKDPYKWHDEIMEEMKNNTIS